MIPDRRTRYYMLDENHDVVATDDLLEWAYWFQQADRHVGDTRTRLHRVSTIFLGIDMRLYGPGEPLVFETMVFEDDGTSSLQQRCSTWAEAAAGHAAAVSEVEGWERMAEKEVEKILRNPS